MRLRHDRLGVELGLRERGPHTRDRPRPPPRAAVRGARRGARAGGDRWLANAAGASDGAPIRKIPAAVPDRRSGGRIRCRAASPKTIPPEAIVRLKSSTNGERATPVAPTRIVSVTKSNAREDEEDCALPRAAARAPPYRAAMRARCDQSEQEWRQDAGRLRRGQREQDRNRPADERTDGQGSSAATTRIVASVPRWTRRR